MASAAVAPAPMAKDPSVTVYRIPYTGYGQCKAATTILGDQGDTVYVVSDEPYQARREHRAPALYRGARPMHRSTLRIPMQGGTDYTTTNKQFHGGRRDVRICERSPQYPSQHITQFDLAHHTMTGLVEATPQNNFTTHYTTQYPDKGSQDPSLLHYPTFHNKMNMNEGKSIRTIMTAPDPTHGRGRYWSQYNRIHNKLGAALGPGVPRERTIRSSYNPLTGADLGEAWKSDNQRYSGNRILYHDFGRKEAEKTFMF